MRNFLLFALALCSFPVSASSQNLSAKEVNAKTADKLVEAISSKNASLLSDMLIKYADDQAYNGYSLIDSDKAFSLISGCAAEGARSDILNGNSMSLRLACKGRVSADPCSSGDLFVIITFETLEIHEARKTTPDCSLTVPPSTGRSN